MKINYNNYPALTFLKQKTLNNLIIKYDGLALMKEHPDVFKDLDSSFRKCAADLSCNIFNISKPFYSAAEKASAKLSKLYLDMIQ